MVVEETFEVRKIQRKDGSTVVNIPDSILKELDIEVDDKVKIEILGRKISIEPIKKEKTRDINIEKQEDKIVLEIKTKGGKKHKLPFRKTTNIHKGKEKATLQAIYTHIDSIRGYYRVGKGEEYEMTLWTKNQPMYSIEDLSHRRNKKSNIDPKKEPTKYYIKTKHPQKN